jgi:hypothetical protein
MDIFPVSPSPVYSEGYTMHREDIIEMIAKWKCSDLQYHYHNTVQVIKPQLEAFLDYH